jgi:hypothetical protein
MTDKIAFEDIAFALQQAKIEPEKQKLILGHLKQVVAEEQANKEENKLPKQKNEFGVILYDAENKLAGLEFTAAVYAIPQNDDHGLVLSKISTAAREQVAATKRKKFPIDTIGCAVQNLKRKFIKDKNVNLKTKNPVRVLVSSNKLV